MQQSELDQQRHKATKTGSETNRLGVADFTCRRVVLSERNGEMGIVTLSLFLGPFVVQLLFLACSVQEEEG